MKEREGEYKKLMKILENKTLRFITLFIFFLVLFYILYYFLMEALSFIRDTTALVLGVVLSPFGKVIVNGAKLSFSGLTLEMIDECTAIFSIIVYCSCILAYPTTLKSKAVGIIFGVPCLYAINILRLFILVLVGAFYPSMFEFVHVYLWQASFIIFVILIFLLWLRITEERGGKGKEGNGEKQKA